MSRMRKLENDRLKCTYVDLALENAAIQDVPTKSLDVVHEVAGARGHAHQPPPSITPARGATGLSRASLHKVPPLPRERDEGIELSHIELGEPHQNADIERFIRTSRMELLDACLFNAIEQAQATPTTG